MSLILYSAPNEDYKKHIDSCLEYFELVFPVYESRLMKVLACNDKGSLREALYKMVLYHDLGKLTQKWQESVKNERKKRPAHSHLGACLLWKTLPEGLKEPTSFAVLIHHTDRGLLSDMIEKPAELAIRDSIVDLEGKVVWHKEVELLGNKLFPQEAKDLGVEDLKEMAINLRIWARGESFLEQHRKRLQAMLCHHILKLCDISAADKREEYQKKNEEEGYYGGWRMVKEIKEYVENIKRRSKEDKKDKLVAVVDVCREYKEEK